MIQGLNFDDLMGSSLLYSVGVPSMERQAKTVMSTESIALSGLLE